MTAGGDKHLLSPEVVVVEEEGKEIEEDYYGPPKLLLDIRRTPVFAVVSVQTRERLS